MNSNLSKHDMSIDCRESTYRYNTLQSLRLLTNYHYYHTSSSAIKLCLSVIK